MTLTQRIRACRTMRGLSRSELAGRLGVHPDTVASWEQDKHRPKPGEKEGLVVSLLSTVARHV
jgi:transcriptional regulator with XRE-family HTH domain